MLPLDMVSSYCTEMFKTGGKQIEFIKTLLRMMDFVSFGDGQVLGTGTTYLFTGTCRRQ